MIKKLLVMEPSYQTGIYILQRIRLVKHTTHCVYIIVWVHCVVVVVGLKKTENKCGVWFYRRQTI